MFVTLEYQTTERRRIFGRTQTIRKRGWRHHRGSVGWLCPTCTKQHKP